MTRRIHLAGSRAQAAAREGVGAALREAFAITDEGDTRMSELIDQLRRIQGSEGDEPGAA